MTNYQDVIDAETWAFIDRTLALYPEDAVTLDIAGQRRVYDQMSQAFRRPRPPGVETEDRQVGTVPVRLYTAGSPSHTVVYLHGGGFVVGGLDSHDDVCAEICAQTGYRVVAVDYRLAPEHQHPAAFDDAYAVCRWASEAFSDGVVLAGDSAGGALAASVAHAARGHLRGILGQVLIYPALGGDVDQGSYLEHAHAPMLSRDEVLFYMDVRGPGRAPRDPTLAPLQDDDFHGLPPTVLISAGCDPIRDDCRDYCDRLTEAGVPVHWTDEPGLVHGYLRARNSVARAEASFERIVLAIEALGQGLWPWS